MSYFDKTQNIAYNNKIIYDFFKTTIQKNEIQSPDTNSSINYLKVTYENNSSNPNFYYTNNGITDSYKVKNLYIFGLIHNNIIGVSDKNKNLIGELVIEMNSTSGKCYVCFFLQQATINLLSTTGDIDRLLKLKNNSDELVIDFTLNNIINNQESVIQYNSTSNNSSVFVFTSPININADSVDIIKKYGITTNLFSINAPTNYSVIQPNNVSLKIDDQIYIDCNPTGESNETIKTYNLPINSELMNEKQDMDYMKTSVNFAMFAVLLIVSYFIVPIFYKFMIIDKIIHFFKEKDDIERNGGNAVLTRIRSADILIGLYFLITASILFIIGMTTDNASMNYGFLLIIVFYILSTSLIIDKKKDKTFMSSYYEDKLFEFPYDLTKDDRYTNFNDLWKFVGKVFKYVIFTSGPKLVIIDLFFFITLLILWLFGQINSNLFKNLLLVGILYILPTIVPLLSLVNEGAIKSNKTEPEPEPEPEPNP
jgi:hypothetical protein